MQKFLVPAKKFAVSALVIINIALVGAIAGAYAMHSYDQGNATQTVKAIQVALKAVPVAQAASPK